MAKNNKVIGFAREFYTLWTVIEIPRYANIEGARVHVGTEWKYTYIQNLSMDLDKALEKVENAWGVKSPEIDESLRGVSSRSFSRYEQRALPYTVFPFGKLMHQEISTADDVWQLTRVFSGDGSIGGGKELDTLIRQKRRVLARRRLIELGELTKVDGKLLTKKEIEHLEKVKASEWFNKDGERVELKLIFVSSTSFETSFGRTYVVTYKDENGRVYIYRGGSPPYIEDKDEFFTVKVTIKHDTYREVKQTLIQRPKVLETQKS